MRGIIFQEFLRMVESGVGSEMLQRLVKDCQLESRGIYLPGQDYDHREILTVVGRLSRLLELPAPGLLKAFGLHLSKSLVTRYPSLFLESTTVFSFLEELPKRIALDPGAITVQEHPVRAMRVLYDSRIPLADLVEGLLLGCIDHYQEEIQIERIEKANSGGRLAVFILSQESETTRFEQ